MKKDVDTLTKALSNIVEDIMLLPEDDTASLNEATSMEDELGTLTLKLIKLTHDQDNVGLRKRLVLAVEYDYPRLAFQLLMVKS